ncbi:MAG: hypothetical protein KF760_08275 [Candidatus Eremiobacteraeota bacterium]|nr:hypothetical protein [Candidatus Eremiobacteraeota bacterium]MCW5870779.1 hypothetical protein [Candidatus Eremiobacteraeota bacterium]
MKKMMMLSLAAITMGSAYAMPTDGEHSYSMQGPATHVRVVSRNRNIPAPSSWTPPERIPSPRVTYVKRDQPKRLGGGFSSPSFSAPAFSSPAFSAPAFSSPAFSSPSSSSPSFSSPGFSSPGTSSPASSSPSFSNPSFSSPGFSN